MTIPDPPWKQKTRPCPFYSQGRCLFSDSCNFLHDVKIKVKQPPDITVTESTSDDLRSPKYASTVATEHQSPGSQVRSPPRSPRLSSLLLALGDVIESDEEGQNDASPIYSYDSLVPPLTSETHGTETTIPIKEPADQSLASEDSASATGGHIPDEAAPSVSYSSLTKRGSGDLLSPIEVKLGVGFLGQLEGTLHREDSIDSGYADGWTGPSPLSLSPPRPQNARRYSTLSLLSSPFGSPARALSPQFTPSAGSAWPTSPLFSPVRSKAGSRPSSLHLSQASNDDLDSPTDYYRRLSAGSPELPTAGLDQDATIRNTATVALHDDDREPPALPTVVAPKKTLDTPTHVLPVEEAVVASNEISPTGSTSPDGPPREDATVEVEVPPISPVFSSDDQTTDEDTTALYGSYYSEVLYTNSPRAAELPPSVRAPPISFIREADVQAAPQRSPSNASRRSSQAILPDARGTPEFVAGSSRDLYSPNRDVFAVSAPASRLGSPALSVRSPAIHSAGGSPSLSRQSSFSERVDQTRSPLKTTTTTKIPFGFRHTAAARSRESVAQRPGSVPLVRHRPPALVGLGAARSQSLSDNNQGTFDEPPLSSSRLRPLRLSVLLSSSTSSLVSPTSSNLLPTVTASSYTEYSRPSSPSVKSDYSLSNHPLLSTSSSEHNIPRPIRNITGSGSTHVQHVDDDIRTQSHPLSAPVTDARSAPWNQSPSVLAPLSPRHLHAVRPSSRFSERGLQPSIHEEESVDDEDDDEAYDAFGDPDLTINVREAIASAPPFTRPTSVASFIHEPVHAIATPRPTLIFAIASDNVEEVRRVLQTGEASPNDDVGPQSALAFALTSNQLKHKAEMVKLLLAHGADPSSLKAIPGHSQQSSVASVTDPESEHGTRSSNPVALADPATRYYIARAEAPQTRRTSALIHRSFFRPLAKVRYEMIGQDRALEQLFRVLSMPAMAPIVVLLCGPSGHGKSLLARRFGSLLDVPTHTVNMTTLRSTHDIWRSYSMSPYEAPSALTLADFLMENEGKRCVVVLDEIEKTENDKVLSSLLMPWELGRCSFEAGHRHVDVSKVIWLGTSNIGHDLVFEHHSSRASPDETMSREEYVDLMGLLRPIVSDRLGPSVLSRVTTVLPFVSFTTDEKLAIAAEALFALAEDAASTLPAATVEKLVRDSLRAYMPAEGARSLYRAVSTQLLETL